MPYLSKGIVKRYLFIALALLIIAWPGLTFFGGCSAPGSDSEARAAIIDQLYSLQPNEVFISDITQQLEACGFAVDLYQGDEITVDLYAELPGYGYRLVLFRAHSGLLASEGKPIKRTCIFTNELYSKSKHVTEQLTNQLARARINKNQPWVFGIGDEFVTRSMKRRFPNTVIIMMGCSGLHLDDLAQAFIQKGASTYMGWNATVGLNYVDEATPILVANLFSEGMTVKEAVDKTMADVGPDPYYHACLDYYPGESGNKTIKELIR